MAESVDIYHVNDQVFVHSTIDGIAKPKTVPTGDQARYDMHDAKRPKQHRTNCCPRP